MSKPGRPSEEDLFEAVRQRDATPIVTWISSPDISVEDGADILGVLRRASSLIMARSTAKKDAAGMPFSAPCASPWSTRSALGLAKPLTG